MVKKLQRKKLWIFELNSTDDIGWFCTVLLNCNAQVFCENVDFIVFGFQFGLSKRICLFRIKSFL